MSTSTMGDAGNRQIASSAEQGTTWGIAKTSLSDVESLPPESCEALLAVLAAHGVLKSWQSTLRCPACNDTMSKEASVPEPTKEGEGKGDEHRAAEALRLFASRVIPYWSLSE